MVKPKHELLKWGIKNTKAHIKHHEKHGKGSVVVADKRTLVKQERKLELLRQAGHKI